LDIRVRRFTTDDTPAFYEAIKESVDHLAPWLMWCTSDYTISDAKEFVDDAEEMWQNGSDYRSLIEDTQTGRVVGCVGINQIVDLYKTGNLGYWVRKSAINSGACSQAVRAFSELALTELGLQRIEITIHPDNHASSAVAEKIGAVYEGTFRNKIVLNGLPAPAKCYSLIPSDYDL